MFVSPPPHLIIGNRGANLSPASWNDQPVALPFTVRNATNQARYYRHTIDISVYPANLPVGFPPVAKGRYADLDFGPIGAVYHAQVIQPGEVQDWGVGIFTYRGWAQWLPLNHPAPPDDSDWRRLAGRWEFTIKVFEEIGKGVSGVYTWVPQGQVTLVGNLSTPPLQRLTSPQAPLPLGLRPYTESRYSI